MASRTVRTRPAAWARFLEALAEGETVTGACRVAGIGRVTAYDERQRDEGFALAWAEAVEAGTDALEDEARRRALAGSDRLLEFLLKARRPSVYRERVSIDSRATIEHRPLTAAELAQARAVGARPELAEALELVAHAFADAADAEEAAQTDGKATQARSERLLGPG